MTVQPDPARLYHSKLLLPDLVGLALTPALHLKAVAKTLLERGVLAVGGRELRVLQAEVLPADLGGKRVAVIVVVVLESDGSGLTLYLD